MAPIMGGRQDRWHCGHMAPVNVYIVYCCTEAPQCVQCALLHRDHLCTLCTAQRDPSMCTMCTAAQRPPSKCTLCTVQRQCVHCVLLHRGPPLNAFKGGVGAFTRGGCCHNITSHPKFLLQALSNGQWKMGAKMFSTIFYQSALESNNWRCVSRELNVTFLL